MIGMRAPGGGRAAARIAFLVAVLALGGCATQQVTTLLAQRPATLPERADIAAVPFFPQEAHQCGPAALATVLAYDGIATTPDALTAEVYLPAREGSLQAEMLAATRRHGFVAYRLAPRLEDVLREVAAGNPVIVLENVSLPIYPIWHYAVVVGYDLPREEIVLRSGRTFRMTMGLDTFEHTWARSKHWAMVAMPPGRLPATADETRYVGAAVALERVDAPAARRAYATALARWPDDLVARLGLGNTAYAAGDLAAAAAAYRQATRDHPGSADAWNNLAQTLYEQHRRDDALHAVKRALALGGPREAQYRQTLQSIMENR